MRGAAKPATTSCCRRPFSVSCRFRQFLGENALMRLAGSIVLSLFCVLLAPQYSHAQDKNQPQIVSASPPASTTAYTLPPDKLAKAKALYDLRGKLRIIDTVFGLVVLLALLYLGIAAKYRDWAERVSRYRFVQAMVFVPLLLLTMTALSLPLDAYQHSISLQYGLTVQD